jgi:hypothetical protein
MTIDTRGDQGGEDTPCDASRQIAILFSGGRDSTLAAIEAHRQGLFLHLLSFESGLGYGGAPLRAQRLREMRERWDDETFIHKNIPTYGLTRQICFLDIVSDIAEDGVQLILLGEFLAMLTAALAYCIEHALDTLAFGAVRYQSTLAEQQPAAIEIFRNISAGYGVSFETPVCDADSEGDVKLRLMDAGFSTKSLEGSSLLSDIDDSPNPAAVVDYINRKSKYLHGYLSARNAGA